VSLVDSRCRQRTRSAAIQISSVHFNSSCPHWRPQDFSRGGQIRGLGQKSPAGSRDGARVWVWGRNPHKLTTGCEKCINNWSTELFTLITNAQQHFFYISRGGGGKCPLLPMPAVAHACPTLTHRKVTSGKKLPPLRFS